jgi:hypothetical protein
MRTTPLTNTVSGQGLLPKLAYGTAYMQRNKWALVKANHRHQDSRSVAQHNGIRGRNKK